MQTSHTKSPLLRSHKHSTPDAKLLVLERRFDVPVAQLFEAFTSAESLKRWWWPDGMYADQIQIDFKVGGRYYINMKGYEQSAGGMTGHFEEIVKDQRIVMTDQFADERGNAITPQDAKMPGIWSEMAYITFEFESIDGNHSRFQLSQEGIPNELQKECIQGWSESFDKLQKYLAEQGPGH